MPRGISMSSICARRAARVARRASSGSGTTLPVKRGKTPFSGGSSIRGSALFWGSNSSCNSALTLAASIPLASSGVTPSTVCVADSCNTICPASSKAGVRGSTRLSVVAVSVLPLASFAPSSADAFSPPKDSIVFVTSGSDAVSACGADDRVCDGVDCVFSIAAGDATTPIAPARP